MCIRIEKREKEVRETQARLALSVVCKISETEKGAPYRQLMSVIISSSVYAINAFSVLNNIKFDYTL